MKNYSQEGNMYNGQLCQENKNRYYVLTFNPIIVDKFFIEK